MFPRRSQVPSIAVAVALPSLFRTDGSGSFVDVIVGPGVTEHLPDPMEEILPINERDNSFRGWFLHPLAFPKK